MGKIQLKEFEIVLSENKNVYQLGEQVIGKCIIGLEGELQLSKIHMKLKGKAQVQFSKGFGKRKRTYSDKIKYLEMDYNFVGNTNNGVITKGIHELPFSYQLPNEGIPSSFVGFKGSVVYWIEAEIEKPMFSFNHKIRKALKIKALTCDNLMLQLSASHEKKSGNISVEVYIDKRGYCPGQTISVNCKITNNCFKRVTPRATLKQIQTYVAKGHKKIIEIKDRRVVGTPVICGLTDVQTLEVPMPMDVQLPVECPLLFVRYLLHVSTEILLGFNLHLDLPIIITENDLIKSSPYSVEINKWINRSS